MVFLNKASTAAELREALELLTKECLNEEVLAAKRWQNSQKRFKKLQESMEVAITERV